MGQIRRMVVSPARAEPGSRPIDRTGTFRGALPADGSVPGTSSPCPATQTVCHSRQPPANPSLSARVTAARSPAMAADRPAAPRGTWRILGHARASPTRRCMVALASHAAPVPGHGGGTIRHLDATPSDVVVRLPRARTELEPSPLGSRLTVSGLRGLAASAPRPPHRDRPHRSPASSTSAPTATMR